VKYVLSASVLAVAIAILICALMPRYYLIFDHDSVVQMGPFATQVACERARQKFTDAVLGMSNPSDEPAREAVSRHMVCLSSR
jgi:hypothetical protein